MRESVEDRLVDHPVDPRFSDPEETGFQGPPPISTVERVRSAVWPLMAALAIGLSIGFAGGYSVASRDRPVATAQPPRAAQGRDSTEVALSAPPERSASGVAAAPAPAARGSAAPPPRRPDQGGASASANPPGAPVDSPAALGRLLVRSTPAGALARIDGREAGQTPVAVRNLQPGAHQVRVEHDGYAPEERSVTLTKAQPAQSITVMLARQRPQGAQSPPAPGNLPASTAGVRFSGQLMVESRPTGAKVYLDGRLVGSTPLVLRAVQAGEHVVRLENDGYRRWTSSIRVVAAESNRVTASLEK